MGRSRGNFHSTDEDPAQRSRRKKNASSGENSESASIGQGNSDGKRALYHCNYCNKDITGRIRIKCAFCPDFDLCVECFSVGAEVTPHKSNHPYQVMDNLSFPLISPDWNADDEILLLEGIEMYGLGNWAEVAEHVGTKNKEQCIDHYNEVYLQSPYFPLPDMSHVVGKNRSELLAMAKGQGDDKKGVSNLGDLSLKEESPFSPSRVKVEDPQKGGSSGRFISGIGADVDGKPCASGANLAAASPMKKVSNMAQVKDGLVKMEDAQENRSSLAKNSSSLLEMSGYNPKRQEFDIEYDNDAEHLLAEMEFKDTDNEDERELKLRILRIYSKRLDERKRRKDFILERNLLYPNPIEKDFTPEEKVICRRYDVFMRFHTKEDHDELIKTVISEHRIRKRIQLLKDARAAGCRTPAELEAYTEQRREAEESARRAKDGSQMGLGSHGAFMGSLDPRAAGHGSSSTANNVEIMGYSSSDLLSENEKRLCAEIRIPPHVYLNMQQVMSVEIFKGKVTKKTDAHQLFQMEPSKIDRVYDMLVRKGIAAP
ncbi:hypothetical protein SAY87_010258 [Trapa incisa]|uniref:Transcriptional adapter n=1 Tax=Trapa incisa TaxID=236973 RepID=A0AAN7JAR1_9MYRT|nr:hypothetical protein SAY87_010258 [Trapa incisa]